jgi:hypothetical protein
MGGRTATANNGAGTSNALTFTVFVPSLGRRIQIMSQ